MYEKYKSIISLNDENENCLFTIVFADLSVWLGTTESGRVSTTAGNEFKRKILAVTCGLSFYWK